MADESSENIGGIDVSVGATHAQMLADLAEAEAALVSRIKAMSAKAVVTISAQMQTAAGGGTGRPGAVPSQGVATAKEVGPLPAANITAGRGSGTAAAANSSLTSRDRALNTDLATRIAKAAPRARAAAGAGGEGDEKEVDRYKIQYLDQIERQRRQAAGAGLGSIDINRSEQSLARQRQREEAATRRQEQQSAAATAKASTAAGRQPEFPPQEQPRGDVRTSSTFAPPLSQHDRAALLSGAPRTVPGGNRYQFTPGAGPRPDATATSLRAAQQQDAAAFAAIDAAQRRVTARRSAEEQIALARATTTAAGRTGRTEGAGLGALSLGNQGKLIELRAKLNVADTAVKDTAKATLPIYDRLRKYEEDLGTVAAKNIPGLVKQRDAFLRDPKTVTALDNETKALKNQASVVAELNKLQSPANILRNLGGITLGGAAFSAGFAAFNLVASATGPLISNILDIMSGFAATSNKVTQALGTQTLALHGNAQQAIATTEAQAGLSTGAAAGINPQLQLATQVKAGAQAATQQQDLFRAVIGSSQGQAPTGLLGSYGGVFNGPLLSQQLGGGQGFAETIQKSFSDVTNQIAAASGFPLSGGAQPAGRVPSSQLGGAGHGGVRTAPAVTTPEELTRIAALDKDRVALETTYNDAIKRGVAAQGLGASAVAQFGHITAQQAADIGASNLPDELKNLAKVSQEGLIDAQGKAVLLYQDAIKRLESAAIGQGIAPPEQLGAANLYAEQQRQKEAAASLAAIQSQQQYVEPSQIAAIARQSNYARQGQIPAGLGVQGIANPLISVTAGVAPQDVGKAKEGIDQAQSAQDVLNAKYREGLQIVEDTYRPGLVQAFGQAAGTAFDTALQAVTDTGSQIADIQTKIAKATSGYEIAQYNLQLRIAKQSLSDISGLTNQNLGAGESQIGILERQNLLLSREGQQFQFSLSQRSINFQTALAGFQAPGVTPEERQARVAEAKLEASYSQKQLDIQRQMFGNQVKIVDLGNLRQAANLAAQIFGPGGLVAGHELQVTLKLKNQALSDLQQAQASNVAVLNSYLGQVDSAVTLRFGQMQALEAAFGKVIFGITETTLTAAGNYFGALTTEVSNYADLLSGAGGTGTGAGGGGKKKHGATGALFTTTGTTDLTVGEAGSETIAILRNPRAWSGSGGGGNTTVININNPQVRNEADIDAIARKVEQVMGRLASLKGLRSSN